MKAQSALTFENWRLVVDIKPEKDQLGVAKIWTVSGEYVGTITLRHRTNDLNKARLTAAAPELLHHLRILAAPDSQCAPNWLKQKQAARAAIIYHLGAGADIPSPDAS
jgi:hypothetical protein